MGLFVDLIELSEPRTNAALELLCKADHGDDDAIWLPHESPFIRRLVEIFTERGLMRLDGFRRELQAWAEGARHQADSEPLPRPAGSMERWTPAEVQLVKLYLESLPPADWTIDDHMMMVDYLTQRYMAPDDLRTEAEWLSTRASLMGRVQANMDKLDARQADIVLAALPATVHEVEIDFKISKRQRAALDFSRVRAAENVRKLGDDVRHKMRGVIAAHAERQALKIPGVPGTSLQTELVDAFAPLNRDWRRIAVTEAGEAANQGLVATLRSGARVKRLEHYRGTCGFCTKINGRVMEVVDPADPDKDGDTQIWSGKTNVGRSAAPRKRIGDALVEREPHELWWVPAGLVHPHCRGLWLPLADPEPGDDPEFASYLSTLLEKR